MAHEKGMADSNRPYHSALHRQFFGAICQSDHRLPLICTESVRLADNIPSGVQLSMTEVYTV